MLIHGILYICLWMLSNYKEVSFILNIDFSSMVYFRSIRLLVTIIYVLRLVYLE